MGIAVEAVVGFLEEWETLADLDRREMGRLGDVDGEEVEGGFWSRDRMCEWV